MKTYILSLLALLFSNSLSFGQNWSWLNQVSSDVDIRNWVLVDSSAILISGASCKQIDLSPDLIQGTIRQDDCFSYQGRYLSYYQDFSFFALLDQQTGAVLQYKEFPDLNIRSVAYHDSTIFLGGLFENTLVIDNQSFVSHGDFDWILMSMEIDGTVKWVHTVGASGRDRLYDHVVDQQGNCYFAALSGSTIINSQPIEAGLILGKIDPDGNYLWLDQPKIHSFRQGISKIAADGDGNLIVGGTFRDSVVLDTLVLKSSSNELFLAKYNSSGRVQWLQKLGGSHYEDFIGGLAVDQTDRIYVSGQSTKDSYFGDSLSSSTLRNQGFLVRFDADGNIERIRRDSLWASYYLDVQISSDYHIAFIKELKVSTVYPLGLNNLEVYVTILDSSFQAVSKGLPFIVRDAIDTEENQGTNLRLNPKGEIFLSRRYYRFSIFNNVFSNATFSNSFIGKLDDPNFVTTTGFPQNTAADSNSPDVSVHLSPNPVQDQFSIQLDDHIQEQVDLSILNLSGQVVREIKGYRHGSPIAVENWESGIYVIRIQANGKQWTKKLVKY